MTTGAPIKDSPAALCPYETARPPAEEPRHREASAFFRDLAEPSPRSPWARALSPDRAWRHGAYRKISRLAGLPLLSVSDRPLVGWGYIIKEVGDRALAALILLLACPLMLLIALAVKFDSPGPVLFRQRRCGLNNTPIEVFKFRSMRHEVSENDAVVRQARRNDERVTRVGRFLRRTSLDELPQLFNVLRGDMSLVGPRPHAVAHSAYYAELIEGYLARHRVKPGITGWAQVNGLRGETDTLDKMEKRVRYDLYYIENWSLWLDLRIILRTFPTVFTSEAYCMFSIVEVVK